MPTASPTCQPAAQKQHTVWKINDHRTAFLYFVVHPLKIYSSTIPDRTTPKTTHNVMPRDITNSLKASLVGMRLKQRIIASPTNQSSNPTNSTKRYCLRKGFSILIINQITYSSPLHSFDAPTYMLFLEDTLPNSRMEVQPVSWQLATPSHLFHIRKLS